MPQYIGDANCNAGTAVRITALMYFFPIDTAVVSQLYY